ncbi:mucin-17-like isoform X13 [Dreissena polymorpha]|uniref:mucin-17-like isoform X13 n=1 Tax=Dreissena polymorpha TaxID=45954 RepID=UPI002263DF2E|nr:mucin-17-like isoform X13 [Dreissena polymorpha]
MSKYDYIPSERVRFPDHDHLNEIRDNLRVSEPGSVTFTDAVLTVEVSLNPEDEIDYIELPVHEGVISFNVFYLTEHDRNSWKELVVDHKKDFEADERAHFVEIRKQIIAIKVIVNRFPQQSEASIKLVVFGCFYRIQTTTVELKTTSIPTTVCEDLVRLNNDTIYEKDVRVSGNYEGILNATSNDANTQYYLHPEDEGLETIVFDLKKEYVLMKIEFESQFVEEVTIQILKSAGENPESLVETIVNPEIVTKTTKTFQEKEYNATTVTFEFRKYTVDLDRRRPMVKNISVYPCMEEEPPPESTTATISTSFTTPTVSTTPSTTTVTQTSTTTSVTPTTTSTVSTTPSTTTVTETPTTSSVPSTTTSTVSTTTLTTSVTETPTTTTVPSTTTSTVSASPSTTTVTETPTTSSVHSTSTSTVSTPPSTTTVLSTTSSMVSTTLSTTTVTETPTTTSVPSTATFTVSTSPSTTTVTETSTTTSVPSTTTSTVYTTPSTTTVTETPTTTSVQSTSKSTVSTRPSTTTVAETPTTTSVESTTTSTVSTTPSTTTVTETPTTTYVPSSTTSTVSTTPSTTTLTETQTKTSVPSSTSSTTLSTTTVTETPTTTSVPSTTTSTVSSSPSTTTETPTTTSVESTTTSPVSTTPSTTTLTETPTTTSVPSTTTSEVSKTPSTTTLTETSTTTSVPSSTTSTVSIPPSTTTVTETPTTTIVSSTSTSTVSTTLSSTTVTETPPTTSVPSTTTLTVSTSPSTTTLTETPTTTSVESTTTSTLSTTPSTTTLTETPATTSVQSTTTTEVSRTPSTTTLTETSTTTSVPSTTTSTVSIPPSTTTVTETPTTTIVSSTSTSKVSTTPSSTTVTETPTTNSVPSSTSSTTLSTTTVTETPTTTSVPSTTTSTVSTSPSTTTLTETPTTTSVESTTTSTVSTTPSTTTLTETPTTTSVPSTTTSEVSKTPSTTTLTETSTTTSVPSSTTSTVSIPPSTTTVTETPTTTIVSSTSTSTVSTTPSSTTVTETPTTNSVPSSTSSTTLSTTTVTETPTTTSVPSTTTITVSIPPSTTTVTETPTTTSVSSTSTSTVSTTPFSTTVTETPTSTSVPSTTTSRVSTTLSTTNVTETPSTTTVPSTTTSTVSTAPSITTVTKKPTTTTFPSTTTSTVSTTPSNITVTVTPTTTTVPFTSTSMVSTSTVTSSSITTVILTTFVTTPHVCIINSSSIPDLPDGDIVGYIEKDGINGFTDKSEAVKDGEMISQGVVVHIKCMNCSCEHGGKMTCVPEEPCRTCDYELWGEWSKCSVTCGGSGWKTRTRMLLSGNILCLTKETENQPCHEGPCIATSTPPCSTWSTWSSCDCQTKSKSRTRAGNCVDYFEEEDCFEGCTTTSTIKPCVDPEILVDCYNLCDDSCKNLRLPGTCVESDTCRQDCQCPAGMRRIQGKCVNETNCPCYTNEGEPVLPGFEMPTDKPCEKCICNEYNEKTCSAILGCCEWSPWNEWSTCSETCGEGIRRRERQMHGDNCDPNGHEETEPCNIRDCPPVCLPDYNLGDVMSNCTCEICYCAGDGTKKCEPKSDENVNGGLTPWSDWSECSKGCDGGTHMRNRSCTNPPPRCGGMFCNGSLVESEPCNKGVSCCDVTDWSPWSECDSECGPGNKTRSRDYKSLSSRPLCNKYLTETVSCTDVEPCDTQCIMSDWTEWSKCSVTCGSGSKTRKRNIESGSATVCNGVDVLEEVGCHELDCTCEPPFVWRNDSLCHSQTCGRRVTNDDCADKLLPACVCPENMYFKDGECVNIVDCFMCNINGVVYRNGETWQPTGTCDICQCIMGKAMCEPVMELPVCEVGETITYEDGPCCPKCRAIQACQLHNKTETLVLDNCKSKAEVTYQYCAGTCGSSKSAPMLSLSNGATPATVDDCKCCKGTTTGTRDVILQCDSNGSIEEVVGYLPLITACKCNTCE